MEYKKISINPATNLNNGKITLSSNIKKLKITNKVKLKETHTNFHRKFKKSSNDFGSNNFLKTEIGFETNSNFYNKTLQTQSNLVTNYSNYNNKQLEEEAKNLAAVYYLSGENLRELTHSLNKMEYTKSEKEEILNRFKIERNIKDIESENILQTVHSKGKFNKIQLSSSNYFFKNPVKSEKKLRLNRQIYSSISKLRVFQQKEGYSKCLDNIDRLSNTINRMPRIREVKSNNGNKFNKCDNSENKLYDEESLPNLQASNFEKNNKMSREQLFSELIFGVDYIKIVKNKPGARSLFSINIIDNKLVLFGGISWDRFCDVWICDLKNNFSWSKVSINESNEPVPRSGHTAVVYRNDIVIYGGSTPAFYNKPREDILFFSMRTKRFIEEKAVNRNEVPKRRNHIAIATSCYMMVHGGIDEFDNYLGDEHLLDLQSLIWYPLESRGTRPGQLAYHTVELVAAPDKLNHINYHFYRTPDLPVNKNLVKKIKHEGIYLFGGIDQNKVYNSNLYVLKIGKRPCEWVKPITNGKGPIGRSHSSLTFYSELNLLFVHGGSNDVHKVILDDLLMLDLESMNWIRPKCSTNLQIRHEHRAFVFNEQLLILGGTSGTKFLHFDFCSVNLSVYDNNRKQSSFLLEESPKKVEKEKSENTARKQTPKDKIQSSDKIDYSKLTFNKEILSYFDKENLQNLIKFTSPK